MRALCVDDALPILEDIVAMCKELSEITAVTGFTRPREAMEWLEEHPVDLTLLGGFYAVFLGDINRHLQTISESL